MNDGLDEIKTIINNYKKDIAFICELKITELCNLKCKYCYREEEKKGNNSNGNVERIVDFFDEVSEIHSGKIVCSFHGGEPLINFDMIKQILFVLSAKSYNDRLVFTVQTNGLLLNDEILAVFQKYKVEIGVSLDLVKKYQYDNRIDINGKGVSQLVKKKIEEMRRRGIPVSTTCVVTNTNINQLEEYVKWAYENRITMIGFNFLRMDEKKNQKLLLIPSVQNYIAVTKKVIDTLIKLNQKEEYKIYVLEISNIVNKIINSYFDCYVCNSPCQAGKRIICLNVDGRIDCCDCVGENDCNTIGYYVKGELANLIKVTKIKKFAVNKNEIEECQRCKVTKYCTYGCAAENMIYYGDKDLDHPGKLCMWYKEIINYLLGKFKEGINPALFVEPYL